MLQINYKSDFAVIINFSTGESVAIPDFDFTLVFSTGNDRFFEVTQKSSVLSNCIKKGNQLIGVFKNHNLGKGVMICREVLFFPNETYPNKIQKIVGVFQTGARLIDGIGDELIMTDVNGILPTADYNSLINKPQINGVDLKGNCSSEDIKIHLSFVSIDE